MRRSRTVHCRLALVVGLGLTLAACAQSEEAVEAPAEEDEAVDIEPPENDCARADPGDPGCE